MNKRILPAYPLFVKDPYFSVWSPADELNAEDTIFWTGKKRPAYGIVTADGRSYGFLGAVPDAEKLKQTSVTVTAFSTDYTFTCEAFDLEVSFLSPLDPRDLDVLSMPVCYLSYTLAPKKKLKDVRVTLALDESHCYDKTAAPLRGGVLKTQNFEAAFFGLRRQMPLSHTGDSCAADWGYWYLAASEAFYLSKTALDRYLYTGKLTYSGEQNERRYLAASDYRKELSAPARGKFLVAFDDGLAAFYFGQWLKGYYFADGRTVVDAMEEAWTKESEIRAAAQAFDQDLAARSAPYGKDYYTVLAAALRQSVAAHKLVKDNDGNVLFLSKECHSNGCIATVDVSYPSIPLFLLYNPELVRGMLRPIFTFARTPVWPFDYAPHDAGTYPYCLGQVYGLKERNDKYGAASYGISEDASETYPMFYAYPAGSDLYDERYQMPVEECGNMLIMSAAALLADGKRDLIEANLDLLDSWVEYLVRFGLMPGEQLCTDDFAGHLDKNVNLSVKAIVGIASYGVILAKLGKTERAAQMADTARRYAAEWKKMCVKNGSSPLTFDGGDTFSLKYNMAFDALFHTGLFEKELRESEVDAVLSHSNAYGVPLDSRASYTKSDWQLWTASLTDDKDKIAAFTSAMVRFLKESPARVPFCDWYDTVTGEQKAFQNRTVQGGLFILLLRDSGLLKA